MEAQTPQETRYEGLYCNLTIQRYSGGVVVLRISGTDIGEFGGAPLLRMDESLGGANRIKLYIDARDVSGASIDVSGHWAQWLGDNKDRLGDIRMLTGSRFVQMTANFVRRFSNLEPIMKVYTEPAVFDAELALALAPA